MRLIQRRVACSVVPPAKALIDGFEKTFESVDVIGQVELEARGYLARRAWVEERTGFCLIDRGLVTLATSCMARLRLAGVDDATSCDVVQEMFATNSRDTDLRYLLAAAEPSESIALFWEREPVKVSSDYFEYQALFVRLMSEHPPARWRLVFPADGNPAQVARDLAADVLQLSNPGGVS